MASPEVNGAALGSSGSPDGVLEDLSGILRGWKKKYSTKKTGTSKRKDVSYIAPNGEEIKTRRHLHKYLKAHPGVLRAGDFCWTSVEAPRRSLRLNRKGRHIRFEELELLPPKRRKRNNDNAKDNTSPVKPDRGRKPGGRAGKPPVAGKDEVMLAVKAEPVEEIDITEASKEPPCKLESNFEENEEDELTTNKSLQEIIDPKSEEVVEVNLLGANSFEEPQTMDVDVAAGSGEEAIAGILQAAEEVVASDIPMEEMQGEDIAAELEETNGVAITFEADHTKQEAVILPIETVDAAAKAAAEPDPDELETDIPVEVLEAEEIPVCNTLAVDEKGELEPEVVDEPNPEDTMVEEILKEEIISFIAEEPLEEEKANGMDVDTFVDDTTLVLREEEIESKEVDLPQPQGIHALVDDTVTFAKPQEEDVSQASLEVSQTILEPIGVLEVS